MPNKETHCKISKKRTNDEFRKLHEWMDEATKYLKHNHRLERHFFTQEYKEFIEKEWGKKAVVEWLFHIALDNLETANKFAVDTYSKHFAEIKVSFDEKEISECAFTKVYPNSKNSFVIDLREKLKKKGEDINHGRPYTEKELLLMGFSEEEAILYADI